MSEYVTRNFQSRLLEQIFAKLEVMDTRLQQVKVKIEQRAFDTKPIWERALAEIGLVKEDTGVIKQDVAVLKEDVGGIKNGLRVLNRKFEVVNQIW